MTVQGFMEEMRKVPVDYEIVLSKVFAVNAAGKLEAVLDYPFSGVAINSTKKEVRFCIEATQKDVEKYFGEFIVTDPNKK